MQTLTQVQFQAAFAHGAVQSVALEPVGSQFAVKFVTLTGEASLVQARGTQPRLFGTTDSAVRLLHKLGVRRIVLEGLDNWDPGHAPEHKRTRPDRAQALTHAAEYDRWVRAKVQASRDSTEPSITHDEWESIRAAKRNERKSASPMRCHAYRVIRRPAYLSDLNAIEAWIAVDNPSAAIDMWLWIDEQVDHLADPKFPRVHCPRTHVPCRASASIHPIVNAAPEGGLHRAIDVSDRSQRRRLSQYSGRCRLF